MNILLKTNYRRDRRPNYAIFLIWSASYASAETLRRGGSMSSYSFFEQLNDYYSHVFSLTPRVYESFFKETRTWANSKISSCCLCVWCNSRELRGSRSPRSPTTMVESFFQQLKVIGQSHI